MIEDEECFRLLMEYQNSQSRYNEAKRFEKYGGDILNAQKKLSDVKFLVDENVLVKEYNQVYKEFVMRIRKIENILFKDIIKEKLVVDIE